MAVSHCFVVPDTAGPISGGTLYNRELLRALAEHEFPVHELSLADARARLLNGAPGFYWLDTLYLHAFPELQALNRSRRPLGLLTHYLPSLIDGAAPAQGELSALQNAAAFIVPSAFMAWLLAERGVASHRCLLVEPGRFASAPVRPLPAPPLAAALVANLLPSKGVLPFLQALALALTPADRFELTIAGSDHVEPEYARECRRVVEESALLSSRARFAGALLPEAAVALVAASNLLISASRFESYGMVLAEARALGVPLLARDGGNVKNHVFAAAGGELVRDERELALASVALARDPLAHRERLGRAQAQALPARPWSLAAAELVSQLPSVEAGLRT